MNYKRKLLVRKTDAAILALSIFVILSCSQISNAQVIPRDTWPESWFHAPKTASELGITEFHQSPMLDERVKNGELPPVKDRLPKDPFVVEPIDEIGQYGGTAIVFGVEGTGWGEGEMLNQPTRMLTIDPELKKILPWFADRWEFKDDGKTLILHLREGLKWSDGEPYTADDWMFWYNGILLNKDMTPYISRTWNLGGEVIKMQKIDDYTLSFHTTVPNPYLINRLAQGMDVKWNSPPVHYLKQFHPDYVDPEELDEKAKSLGYDLWTSYFGFYYTALDDPKAATPVMNPFVVVKKSPALIIAERNPYYPVIDPQGNQLPYIDRIEVHYVYDTEMMTATAATGQATFAGHDTKTSDIPLFKKHEEKGNYKTYIWRRVQGADVTLQFNFNALLSAEKPDYDLRKIFWDPQFRKALSLAIDREEINRIVYYGRGVARQTTVLPTSKFYEEEFAQAYAQYDPDEANRLLDEVGMKDINGDGIRERPDGKPLAVTLEWTPMETPKELITELVIDQWRKVGIDIRLKQVSQSLQVTRANASLMQMTLWHADRCTDILFSLEPYWFAPTHIYWETCMWNEWTRWFFTDGTRGEEPPAIIKDLYNWWDQMNTTFDEAKRLELGKKILQTQAENIWTIGTIGLAPHPIIVSDKLNNVTKNGYWGWDGRFSAPYHPETWYLKEEK